MDKKPTPVQKKVPKTKVPANDPRENLIKFTKLVIEVLGFGKKGAGNQLIELSNRYKTLILRSDMKIEQQHTLFRDLFVKYRDPILASGNTDIPTMSAWAVKAPVEIWFGEHSEKFKRNEYRLKIAAAYTSAKLIRDGIDKQISKEADNPNLAELERGKYEYSYIEMLNYELYLVISDALGVIHSDFADVKALSEYFRSKTCLRDRPADVGDETGSGLGEAISRATETAGGGKVDGKKISQAIDTLAGDDGLIGNITGIFEKAVKAREAGAASGGGKGGAMTALLQELAPDIETTFEGLTDLINGATGEGN